MNISPVILADLTKKHKTSIPPLITRNKQNSYEIFLTKSKKSEKQALDLLLERENKKFLEEKDVTEKIKQMNALFFGI